MPQSCAFSAQYALKDLGYALECAGDVGLKLSGAELARALLQRVIARGLGGQYWSVIAKVV